jgi:hypothetical protein
MASASARGEAPSEGTGGRMSEAILGITMALAIVVLALLVWEWRHPE